MVFLRQCAVLFNDPECVFTLKTRNPNRFQSFSVLLITTALSSYFATRCKHKILEEPHEPTLGIFAKYKSTYSGHKTTGLQLETCVTLDQLYVPPIICYLMFVSILCAKSTMRLGPNSPRRAMATAGQLMKVTSSRLTPPNTGIFVVATPPSSTFMPYVWMHRSWSPLLPTCQTALSTARTTLAAQLLRRAREKKIGKKQQLLLLLLRRRRRRQRRWWQQRGPDCHCAV